MKYMANRCAVYCPPLNTDFNMRQGISTAMWRPRKNEPFPNPWFDVANFIPSVEWSNKEARRFPFTSLPLELIAYIARFLPKESAAALALTNKTMYTFISRQRFNNLSTLEHWRLILLLERDSDLLVACQECMELHSPIAPLRYQPGDVPCMNQQKYSLPSIVTPALCRLLAKRYIRQEPYSDLLAAINETYVYTLPDFKIYRTITFHMSTGNLLVRQETSIAPLTDQSELTSRSAFLLHNIMDGKYRDVCPHVRWQHLGMELCYDAESGSDYPSSLSAQYLGRQQFRDDYLTTASGWFQQNIGQQLYAMDNTRANRFYQDDRYATAHQDDFDCGGNRAFHSGYRCYDKTPVPRAVLDDTLGPGLRCALLHTQPCANPECDKQPTRSRVNLVRACEICATDMCVSAQDIRGIGRVLSLTTWKNVGGVYDGQWANWYTHSLDVGRFTSQLLVNPEYMKIARDLTKGTTVYSEFENLSSSPGEPPARWYTASIGRRVLAAFQGESTASNNWMRAIPHGGLGNTSW